MISKVAVILGGYLKKYFKILLENSLKKIREVLFTDF